MLATFQNIFAEPRHMILLIAAAWLGLTLSERRTENFRVTKDDLNNIIFYMLTAFVVGGRVLYVFQNIGAFAKSPVSIISINPNLFDPLGGLAAGLITMFVYNQMKEIPIWNALDSLTPFFAVIAIGVGLSHLASGDAFGIPTDLPWGVKLWNAYRHPTQIYETLASLMILGWVWRFKPKHRSGLVFLTFAALTCASHLFLQSFRANDTFLLNQFRSGQILAWCALLISFIFLESRLTNESKTG